MHFLESIDSEAIGGLLERDEFFWLDLTDPGAADSRQLQELLGFHPLALEDMLKREQRPKLEDYGDYMFLVYYGAGRKGGGTAGRGARFPQWRLHGQLPPPPVVGFFGQNFKWLVVNINSAAAFWVLGMGSLVLSVVGLSIWFRRRSYL